jgi:hypothetical protein
MASATARSGVPPNPADRREVLNKRLASRVGLETVDSAPLISRLVASPGNGLLVTSPHTWAMMRERTNRFFWHSRLFVEMRRWSTVSSR